MCFWSSSQNKYFRAGAAGPVTANVCTSGLIDRQVFEALSGSEVDQARQGSVNSDVFEAPSGSGGPSSGSGSIDSDVFEAPSGAGVVNSNIFEA